MSRVSFATLFTAAVAASATPAFAADMYGGRPAPAPYAGYSSPSPVANWAGAYLGVQLGYAWGSVKNTHATNGTGKGSLNSAAFGIYGGVNTMLTTNFVLGAEADLNLAGQGNSMTLGGVPYRNESDWHGTIRARLGVAFDRIMPFATAGLAFGENWVRRNGAEDSTTDIGLALGAGIEGLVTDNISVKVEYMHLDFGKTNLSPGGAGVNTSLTNNILRAGVAYRF